MTSFMLQITIVNDLCNATRYQPVPVVAGYSHSIVNEPFLRFNINGLLIGLGVNTMKNTMFKKSCQLPGKIAD